MKQQMAEKWMAYEKRWKWRNFYYHKILRRNIFERFFHYNLKLPYYAHRWLLSHQKANDWIASKIRSGEAFMVSRVGNSELQVAVDIYRERFFGSNKEYEERFAFNLNRIKENAGFFPADRQSADRFTDLYIKSCSSADLLGVLYLFMDDFVYDEFVPEAKLTYLGDIEPFGVSNPWSAALKNKKVLVIHPFDESIRSQYERRAELFPGTEILPEFELYTLKAVQTIAGITDERFATWFDALEYMYEEAMKKDFDIAIIACGAYGLPLAAKLKEAGKQAIHLGGVTQILFGIKGKRWVDSPMAKMWFNDAWVYPKESETPKNSKVVENNCYWQ